MFRDFRLARPGFPTDQNGLVADEAVKNESCGGIVVLLVVNEAVKNE